MSLAARKSHSIHRMKHMEIRKKCFYGSCEALAAIALYQRDVFQLQNVENVCAAGVEIPMTQSVVRLQKQKNLQPIVMSLHLH